MMHIWPLGKLQALLRRQCRGMQTQKASVELELHTCQQERAVARAELAKEQANMEKEAKRRVDLQGEDIRPGNQESVECSEAVVY